MDDEATRLVQMHTQGGDVDSLAKAVVAFLESKDGFFQAIDSYLKTCENAPMKSTKSVTALFAALFCGLDAVVTKKSSLIVRKRQLVAFLFDYLCSCEPSHGNEGCMKEILTIISTQADTVPYETVVRLFDTFVAAVKNPRMANNTWVELLSKILSRFKSCCDDVTTIATTCSGVEAHSKAIDRLVSTDWPPELVLSLISSFKDCTLSTDETQRVVKKALSCFSRILLTELKPLVCDLLLIALSKPEIYEVILIGIFKFLADLRTKTNVDPDEAVAAAVDEDSLNRVESDVICEILFAIKQSQKLGRTFVKLVKTDVLPPLVHFNSKLALSLFELKLFHEEALEVLSSALMQALKDQERQRKSHWARQFRFVSAVTLPETFILSLADSSAKFEMDFMVGGLCEFGVNLLTTCLPKVPGTLSHSNMSNNSLKRACNLGRDLLVQCFKLHLSIRERLFQRMLDEVLLRPSTALSFLGIAVLQRIHQRMKVLRNFVEFSPTIVQDCMSHIRCFLDHLHTLPADICEPFICCLVPILKIQPSSRDALIIVLRKTAFSKDESARKISVIGFLTLLKHLRIIETLSTSQNASCACFSSQVTSGKTQNNSNLTEALCLEVVGCLRRTLTQQAEIRHVLYEGLSDVISVNGYLLTSVLEILYQQARLSYEPDEAISPPLLTAAWIAGPVPMEPFGALLKAIVHCLGAIRYRTASADIIGDIPPLRDDEYFSESPAYEIAMKCIDLLEKISCRMATVTPEDFDLDKGADFGGTTSTGIRNCLLTFELLGVYEALVEFRWRMFDYSADAVDSIQKLICCHMSFAAVLKERSVSTTGKKVVANAPHNAAKPLAKSQADAVLIAPPAQPLISLHCLQAVCDRILCDQLPMHNDALSKIREEPDSIRWWMEMMHKKITALCKSPDCTELRQMDVVCKIARLMQMWYSSSPIVVKGLVNRVRLKSLHLLSLEILANLWEFAAEFLPNCFDQMLVDLVNIEPSSQRRTSAGDCNVAYIYCQFIERALVQSLISLNDDAKEKLNADAAKEALTLVRLLRVFAKQKLSDFPEEKLLADVTSICQDTSIDDTVVSKTLAHLLLNMHRIHTDFSKGPIVAMVFNLLYTLGSQNGVEQKEPFQRYQIISKRSSHGAFSYLTAILSDYLDDASWALSKLKASSLTGINGASSSYQRQECVLAVVHDKALCALMKTLMNVLTTLASVKSPLTVCDVILKILSKFYTVLTGFISYMYCLSKEVKFQLPLEFEQLVRFSAKSFGPAVSGFICYQQEEKTAALQTKQPSSIVAKTKVLREMKNCSDLVFAMESYEANLIQLSQKFTAVKSLLQHFKKSDTRDFRIDQVKVREVMEHGSSDDEELVVVRNASASSAGRHPRKRPRSASATRGAAVKVSKKKGPKVPKKR